MPIAVTLLAVAAGALARAPSHYVLVDGARVHYKSLGRGPATVLFVHGWSCSLEVWRLQAPGFAARARALFVDLPGHGRSDVPRGSCTQDLFARALDAVLDDAGASNAVVVGHSNGAITARHFYRLFPVRARALVLVDGNLRPFIELSRYPILAASYDSSACRKKIAAVVTGMTDQPSLRAELVGMMTATPRSVVVSSLAELQDPRVWQPDPIAVPFLAIHARAPHWTPDYESYVRRLAPDADYRVWDGVGHFLMMERPQEFDAAVLAFLDSRGLLGLKTDGPSAATGAAPAAPSGRRRDP